MINPNSLVAYFGTQPKINRKQCDVLEAIIELNICSDSEICEHLKVKYPLEKWAINKVTNRRGELKGKGLIVLVDGAHHNEDGYSISKWKVNTNYDIEHGRIRPEVKQNLLGQRVNRKLF